MRMEIDPWFSRCIAELIAVTEGNVHANKAYSKDIYPNPHIRWFSTIHNSLKCNGKNSVFREALTPLEFHAHSSLDICKMRIEAQAIWIFTPLNELWMEFDLRFPLKSLAWVFAWFTLFGFSMLRFGDQKSAMGARFHFIHFPMSRLLVCEFSSSVLTLPIFSASSQLPNKIAVCTDFSVCIFRFSTPQTPFFLWGTSHQTLKHLQATEWRFLSLHWKQSHPDNQENPTLHPASGVRFPKRPQCLHSLVPQ